MIKAITDAKRVAFQGEPGAYSDLACRNAYPNFRTLPCPTFEAAIDETVPVYTGNFRIVRDITAVFPSLRGARVVAERVGLRPVRPEVRLDAEALPGGRVLWHNYGHGGAGVTLSWGCAREVAAVVLNRA